MLQPRKLFKVVYVLLSILFCFCGCSKDEANLSVSEKVELERFFFNLLIDEPGIFTLMGSKPMTEMYLADPSRGLKDWTIIERLPLSDNFLLFQKEEFYRIETGEKIKLNRITFVNIKETVSVLEKNYHFFCSAVGFNFDPLGVVYELGKEHSDFWERLRGRRNYYQWGILYGFGEKNSLAFHEKFSGEKPSMDLQENLYDQELIDSPSIEKFSIPTFVSFSDVDPVIKQYEDERKKIQKIYKGKNFLKETIKQLSKKNLNNAI